jgi:hypothetical protein
LPTRTELNAKTRPNSGALIEWWGYFVGREECF